MKYQTMHVPKDLMKAINDTDSSNNNIQVNHFDSDHSIVSDDYSKNNKDGSQTQYNDNNNYGDESHGELDSPWQLNDIESNKIVYQENQILLFVGSINYTSVSAKKLTGLSSTSTFLQGLFLQYLHKVAITIL